MKTLWLKTRSFLFGNDFQLALTFLFSGFLSGAVFTWLTRSPELENLFFTPATKFPVARFSWYVTFGLFQLLGLIIGFLVSTKSSKFTQNLRLTAGRSFVASLLVVSAAPLLYGFLSIVLPLLHGSFLLLSVPLIFLAILALAMCILTGSLRMFSIALFASVLFTVIGFAAYLLTLPLWRAQGGNAVEFGQWAFLFASLSLSFGYSLLWSARTK